MRKADVLIETDEKILGMIRRITKADADYPEAFRNYPRMPEEFYVLGNLPDPEKKTVAIVGARGCTPYGRAEALRFGRVLAEHGVQIISGMAYGVDSWAEQGALEGGGTAFSVLGSGVDVCYPRENGGLYRKIISGGGGILSEFEPGALPLAWHFPIRNRLISALADVVLVVEAKIRSGSLITADYAMEQGKTIYAVPGRNRDALSQGCNRLISEGAGIAWSPDSILYELGLGEGREAFQAGPLGVSDGRAWRTAPYAGSRRDAETGGHADGSVSGPEDEPAGTGRYGDRSNASGRKLPPKYAHADDFQKIFGNLSYDPVSVDGLVRESGLDVQTVTSVLMQLCISGYAEEAAPGFYIRK